MKEKLLRCTTIKAVASYLSTRLISFHKTFFFHVCVVKRIEIVFVAGPKSLIRVFISKKSEKVASYLLPM